MNGYPICKIEAFAASISKLNSLEDQKEVTQMYIASQGSGKIVTDYIKSLTPSKKSVAESTEDFLSDFQAGFKGLE